MPQGLSQEAVAEWLHVSSDPFNESRCPWGGLYNSEREPWLFVARAVLALVSSKVREGVRETIRVLDEIDLCDEDERTIVARVMNKEATNG